MLVAKSEEFGHIFTATEASQYGSKPSHRPMNFTCPICKNAVKLRGSPDDQMRECFTHEDSSEDCFETDLMSEEHRIAAEMTMKVLYNRLRAVTGEPVQIDVERWIGTSPDFVIADVRASGPLQIAAEIFYKATDLALGRRLNTMFENGYSSYLIFHGEGTLNADRVERHIQKIAPLRVGRFDPTTLELTLGDLFSQQQIEFTRENRSLLPEYILRSPLS